MKDDFDILLICDPVPGRRHLVVEYPGRLSKQAREEIQRQWKRYTETAGAVLILDKGMTLKEISASQSWPGAEFCAA